MKKYNYIIHGQYVISHSCLCGLCGFWTFPEGKDLWFFNMKSSSKQETREPRLPW